MAMWEKSGSRGASSSTRQHLPAPWEDVSHLAYQDVHCSAADQIPKLLHTASLPKHWAASSLQSVTGEPWESGDLSSILEYHYLMAGCLWASHSTSLALGLSFIN